MNVFITFSTFLIFSRFYVLNFFQRLLRLYILHNNRTDVEKDETNEGRTDTRSLLYATLWMRPA